MDDVTAIHLLANAGVQLVARWPRRAVCFLFGGKRRYSFNATPSTTQEVDVERHLSTRDWHAGVLVVRLHAKTTWATGTVISVIVRRTSQAEDDPSVLFVSSVIASVDIPSTATAPRPFFKVFSAPIPSEVSVAVRITQPATAGVAAADLAIELVGRTTTRGPESCLPDVCRPRSGIVPPGSAAITFREGWGASTTPWQSETPPDDLDVDACLEAMTPPDAAIEGCSGGCGEGERR